MSSGEKILLLHGQGPAGSWITKLLLERGIEFVLLDRRPDNSVLSQVLDPRQLPGVERAFGDPADPQFLAHAIGRLGITRLISLARGGAGPRIALAAAAASGGRVAMTAYASGPSGEGEDEARALFQDRGVPSLGIREVEAYGVGRESGLGGAFTRALKAAALDRRFTIPFTGTTVVAFAEDVARTFIDAVLAGAPAAAAGKPRTQEVAVESFIAKLAEAVPASAGRIDAAGDFIAEGLLVDDPGGEGLPGMAGVAPTAIEDGIRRTLEHFSLLAEEGRLREDGLAG